VTEATCASEFRRRAVNADVIVLDIAIPLEPNGMEVGTAGLDTLLELQQQHPDHPAIHNPIIRSMWSQDLFGPRYQAIIQRVPRERWCSREVPVSELHALIEKTFAANQSTNVNP
jgi:hypothetical protein